MLKDDADVILFAGYGGGAVLLLLYFVWESGPCHWSGKYESSYLCCVLFLFFCAAIVWERASPDLDNQQGIMNARLLVRLLLVFRIAKMFVLQDVHPKFFEKNTSRAPAKRVKGITRRAKHKAQLVEEAIGEIQEITSGRNMASNIADKLFEPILFFLVMVEDLMRSNKTIMFAIEWPLLVCVFILPVGRFVTAIRMCFQLSTRKSRIHAIFEDLIDLQEVVVLQHILATVSVGTLMEVMRWDTFNYLTNEALRKNLLCTTSKAILIDALQMVGIRHNTRAQFAVRDLILSCQGAELTTLKNLIDGSGSYRNLYKLIHVDITKRDCRSVISHHLAAEATIVREKLGQAVGVKLLSDVDDTLYSSGGHFPAGCDKSYPKHTVYAGFLKLLKVLDKSWDIEGTSCNLVFLSARPHIYKDYAEDKSYRLFQSLVSEGRLHSFPTLLPGRLPQGLWAFFTSCVLRSRAWRPVGDLKYTTYRNYRELYREYDFVFCGDNGQGDLLAGQRMIEEQSRSVDGTEPKMLCVLIREVVPEKMALAQEAPAQRGKAWRESLEQQRLILHKSYVGAACALHRCDPNLVSPEQVSEIAHAALDAFDADRWASDQFNWCEAEQALRNDFSEASQILSTAGLPPLPEVRASKQLYEELAVESSTFLGAFRHVCTSTSFGLADSLKVAACPSTTIGLTDSLKVVAFLDEAAGAQELQAAEEGRAAILV
jgi:hypothetical protein